METTQTGPPLNRPETVHDDHVDDPVLQISGAGHWYLEGWIGDHSVEFLVDSGSSVTAMSDSLYQTCWCTRGSVRMYFKDTVRCQWNWYRGVMGLLTEFPILVCDLASGTDVIIGL